LRRAAPLFGSVRAQLDLQLTSLGDELRRLHSRTPAGTPPAFVDRAIDRIAAVSDRLSCLDGGAPGPATPQEAERLFFAREAHLGAAILAGMVLGGVAIAEVSMRAFAGEGLLLGATPELYAGMGIVAVGCLAWLAATWDRPSEAQAMVMVMLLIVVSLASATYAQSPLLALGRPYAPMTTHRLLILMIPLVLARRLWLAITLVLAVAVEAFAIFYLLHLDAHKDIMATAEPWPIAVYVGIGIALSLLREQRRLASMRVLRAEWEAAALQRRAGMYLALRDLLNSPLQVLVLGTAQLERAYPGWDSAPLRVRVERFIALSKELADLDELVPEGAHRAALDAERELGRERS
jgi:hypothetical protein